ncbi:hypothetical protein BD311DRAFT_332001 [Dichomitus squalens]|uniref:Uncharacterized protein n=1 Tax=Dichomitus squalens TaxID=114155 RepID=A0A4Q9MQ71_9APHY|nr:hypothetical protein BD311DRAFT_332001 [Dichomitus squalens]
MLYESRRPHGIWSPYCPLYHNLFPTFTACHTYLDIGDLILRSTVPSSLRSSVVQYFRSNTTHAPRHSKR